jgi:protein arginine N-methyltransferase 1
MLGPMYHYSLTGYGSMIADAIRLPAYRRAIEQAVRSGDVVADLGAGPGVMALLACRAGAGHVYAIEPNPALEAAREVAAANGLADRITFLPGLSTALTPPQRCQVIVSDLRGCVPLYERHIPILADARARWLAPGGRLIPRRDFLHAALVEHEAGYADYDGPWRRLGRELALDLGAVRRRTVNTTGQCRLGRAHLLGPARPWAELDYRVITEPDVAGSLALPVARPGTAHGFALWFDAELGDGIGYSNAPGEPALVYGQYFFPFEEPLPVRDGEVVTVDLAARLVGGDYVWRWNTTWSPAETARHPPVRFRQSTFLGELFSLEQLRRRDAAHRPRLNADGRAEQAVLAGMTGGATLAELAASLAAQQPERFPDAAQALEFVRATAARCSA